MTGSDVLSLEGDAALVAALAAGKTQEESAVLAKVSVRTVQRRLADDAFRKRVDDAQALIIDAAVRKMVASSVRAAEVLAELLDDADAPKSVKAKLALELLARVDERAARVSVLERIGSRLERLEVALGLGDEAAA